MRVPAHARDVLSWLAAPLIACFLQKSLVVCLLAFTDARTITTSPESKQSTTIVISFGSSMGKTHCVSCKMRTISAINVTKDLIHTPQRSFPAYLKRFSEIMSAGNCTRRAERQKSSSTSRFQTSHTHLLTTTELCWLLTSLSIVRPVRSALLLLANLFLHLLFSDRLPGTIASSKSTIRSRT